MTRHNKHTNQVRIIGGICRGRKLHFMPADGLRPTPDMVREKLFNWLGQDLTGKTVLDLFSGSGALGFEAASRNARQVVLVDNNRQTAGMLKKNAAILGLQQIEIAVSEALLFLNTVKTEFDVVFLDPPFGWNKWSELFAVLADSLKHGATVYVEAQRLPDFPAWLVLKKEGAAGMSRFALAEVCQVAE